MVQRIYPKKGKTYGTFIVLTFSSCWEIEVINSFGARSPTRIIFVTLGNWTLCDKVILSTNRRAIGFVNKWLHLNNFFMQFVLFCNPEVLSEILNYFYCCFLSLSCRIQFYFKLVVKKQWSSPLLFLYYEM